MFPVGGDQAEQDVASTLRNWRESGLLGPLPEAHSVHPTPPAGDSSLTIASFTLGRSRFRLVTNTVEAERELAPRLEALTPAGGDADFTLGIFLGPNGRYGVFRDGQFLSVENTVGEARTIVLQEIVRLAEPGREWLALFHAAVCVRDKRCFLFAGPSRSGKSTLSARLYTSGWTLYSDDFAGLMRSDLRVPAMPFAMALREGSWTLVSERLRLQDAPIYSRSGEQVKFIASSATDAEPVLPSALVFTRRLPGVDSQATDLSTFDAVLRLNEAGFWVQPDISGVRAFLQWLDALPKWELQYGEAADAARYLSSL